MAGRGEISTIRELIEALKQLPPEEQLEVAKTHILLIKKEGCFQEEGLFKEVLEQLRKCDQPAFMKYLIRLTSGDVDLSWIDIFDSLQEKGPEVAAERYQADIPDRVFFGYVLMVWPQEHRLNFAEANQHKIEDGFHLSSVLEQLREEDRLNFAVENQGKIKWGDGLARVLEQLLPADRQEFRELVEGRWQAERSDAASIAKHGLLAESPEGGADSDLVEAMAAGAAGVIPQEEDDGAEAEAEAAISPARR